MATTLAVIHIVVCVFLILLIMIQDPKGGGSGLFSGGGSNSILGTSGGADFLTKATRYMAIAFGTLCVALTIFTKPTKSGVFSNTVLPPTAPITAPVETTPTAKDAAPAATEAPAAPAAATPATPEKK